MEISSNHKIIGIPDGIYYGQNERVDEINSRIIERSVPDIPLAPNFDPRPIPTKYSLFPIVNRRASYTERIMPAINHTVELNFNPGTRNAPPNGYFVNIDTETELRNQTVALQHGAHQGVYIPSSNSDLYKNSVIYKPSHQPFPKLFESLSLDTRIPANLERSVIGKDTFSNHTRTQLGSL